MKKLIHIISKDGRYFVDEVDDTLSDKEVVEVLLKQCCIPLKAIYKNATNFGAFQLIWEAQA